MTNDVRVRPWQLALVSIAGGAVGALVLALLQPTALESQTRERIASFAPLARQVMPAVVNINTTKNAPARGARRPFPRGQDPFEQFFGEDFWERFGGRRGPQKQRSLGSGFVISSDGYIITNHHVVDGADDIDVQFSNGKSYKAKIVGSDAKTDVALLKIDPKDSIPHVALGDSDQLHIGDWVVAVGNPFGLEHTMTAGIVSAQGRQIGAGPYDDFIQTDASINPGNSGGPLFDQDGQVVGIASAIFSQTGGNIGIGFAIPINLARAIVEQLRAGGKVVRGWLGVSIQPLAPDLRQALGLGDQEGALISDVMKDSPAEKAGLKRGDVVVGLNGDPVTQPGALSRSVAMMRPGTKIELAVLRDGKERKISVTIGRLPDDQGGSDADGDGSGGADDDGDVVERLGLALDTLNDAMRRQLDLAKDVKGAVVTAVAPGGPAEEAGMRPGDVIVEVDRRGVDSAKSARAAIQAAKPPILLLVRRGESTIFLTLTPDKG